VTVPRWLTTGIAGTALAAGLVHGFFPIRDLPALGPLLDPAHGVWAAARTAELRAEESAPLAGLGDAVTIEYDDRGVPHIFAATELDAFRALGWVHARDRLFQMEMTQRAAAGTLTEVAGARTLELDRAARARGLPAAAAAKWAALAADDPTRAAIVAYMDGVNAWIAQASSAELPIEYKLLGVAPRRFEPVDCFLLLMQMAQSLSYRDDELRREAIEALIGAKATEALFPVNAPIQEPIEPVPGRTAPTYLAMRFPAPTLPTPAKVATARARLEDGRRLIADVESETKGEAVVGSNNWAVGPTRSASGRALLSGDPHLQLTLPSIWYEVHLVAGELDLYGVSLPLSPVIPIGFNRDVAWTATNTGADVVDFYRETVDDSIAPTTYLLDGEWMPITARVETFRGKRGEVLATDTLYTTHRGPLRRTSAGWTSQRWTALEPSNEAGGYLQAIRARSVDAWYDAMQGYRAPAQNFLVADRSGRIAIRSTGRFPIRPGDGRGDRIQLGATRASDWTGDWPAARLPQAMAPAQGYLASANQQPLDPTRRPGYLGWDWPTPWRAMRINQILRADTAMTPEKMRLAHTDPQSALTAPVLTALRDAMRAQPMASEEARDALAVLEGWDQHFDPESQGAVLFDAVLRTITNRTWDELIPEGDSGRAATPNSMLLVRLFEDRTSIWWDDRRTPEVREDRNQILVQSLAAAWRDTRAQLGNDPATWRWRMRRLTHVRHLLQLPGFDRESLAVQAGPGTLSPSEGRGTAGASWRFVVELGDTVQAWGIYPGGQSGNPVSSRYADRLEGWRLGQLNPLHLPRKAGELSGMVRQSVLTLTPVAR
jgi:penicillin amidase